MPARFKQLLPHLLVFLFFIIAALVYFSPVLQGKQIYQSDIVQYRGMAKQQNDFREDTGEETYWTDSAFGGMPTYQLGAKYPHNYIKTLDLTLRFLPRPADYLFLYFIGLYILLLILKVDYKLALLGALGFGFSTYLIIILGVGHNAKAHAIAYMPLVLGGIILTFQKRYVWGFLLTTVAVALELVANHFQMTYYLLFVIICLGIAYFIDAFRKKILPHFFKSVGILVVAAILALGLNATNIMATKEYADTSTRGKSELTLNPDGSPKENTDGLDYEYITTYSYGKLESFNLLIPNLMGGGSGDPLPKDSETQEALLKLGVPPQDARQISNQIPAYWGDQPIVAAPAYIGAIMIFLAVLAVFLIKGRLKWWCLAALLLSLTLSWGRNFEGLTRFFIDYVPLYNKFRAVSSIQVIIELIVPILAVVGLHRFFNDYEKAETRRKHLLYAVSIVGGVILIFLAFKGSLLDFSNQYDEAIRDQLGIDVYDAVRADRASLFQSDAIRSLILVLLSAGVLWFLLKKRLKETTAIIALGALIVFDLVGVDRRYVNNDDFISARLAEQPFQQNGADMQILKDEDHFRVFDNTTDAFNSGRASYFHNALGGYHAAKPGRMNDLYDRYISQGDIGMLNMLNVRYIITTGPNGGAVAQRNPYANGNAWMVENVMIADNADQELAILDSLNTRTTAVIHTDFKDRLPVLAIQRDSTASIELNSYQPNRLSYNFNSNTDQLVVFSEAWYPHGWTATLDGNETDYIRANYCLRAMVVPKGSHRIEFSFQPEVVQSGSRISMVSTIVLLILVLAGAYFEFKKKKTNTNPEG